MDFYIKIDNLTKRLASESGVDRNLCNAVASIACRNGDTSGEQFDKRVAELSKEAHVPTKKAQEVVIKCILIENNLGYLATL